MAEEFSLRCYCFIDRMQAQYAPLSERSPRGSSGGGMAALYVEMAPATRYSCSLISRSRHGIQTGAQIVEREFGMFEVHSLNQAAVLEAGQVVLDSWNENGGSHQPKSCPPSDHTH
jgi:hypothetical protein